MIMEIINKRERVIKMEGFDGNLFKDASELGLLSFTNFEPKVFRNRELVNDKQQRQQRQKLRHEYFLASEDARKNGDFVISEEYSKLYHSTFKLQ